MKATELRVGNLVFNSMGYFEADYISIGLAHNYKPIPLTEDWLLKFGYDKKSGYFTINGHVIFIEINRFLCNGNDIELKYVHQLQNFYFAITGTELELKTNK